MELLERYRIVSTTFTGILTVLSVFLGYHLLMEGMVLQKVFGIAILVSALLLLTHYAPLITRKLANG
ncbi:MAG: hypothetical protein SVS85_01795 [Candidatus Nanohaloarchaea archaeon]|nr:hypothetical protein [Candidatus Nanohaloarchaea archaeon]